MSWQNAPRLNKLTAAQNGGNRGAQLWGIDFKGQLYTIYQKTPGGEWSGWIKNDWAPELRVNSVWSEQRSPPDLGHHPQTKSHEHRTN